MPFRSDDGIFEEGFIEERRKGLEQFLNKYVLTSATIPRACTSRTSLAQYWNSGSQCATERSKAGLSAQNRATVSTSTAYGVSVVQSYE